MRRLTLPVLLLLASALPGSAQSLSLVDSLHASGDLEDALHVLDSLLMNKGPGPELSWRAARAAVNRGMLIEKEDRDAAREAYLEAEAYALAGIEADETDAAAWEWLAVARGRRSLTEGLRTRATLVNGVRDASMRALALDSTRSGAHHVFGMWHAEIRRLNTFERMGAGALGADDFGKASWDDALFHLERAASLAPEALVHGLELAKVYRDVDRDEDAIRELRRVIALDALEPTDELLRAEARELLGTLEGGERPEADPAPEVS